VKNEVSLKLEAWLFLLRGGAPIGQCKDITEKADMQRNFKKEVGELSLAGRNATKLFESS
jgi:hypothetical protein